MASRLDLQNKLEELLGCRHVYYQPPESVKMEYPAIRYSKKNIKSTYANDAKYSMTDCYELIVMDRRPDNPVIKKLLALPYSSYDRTYNSDNLCHDVITLYF
jgi:hypothetical protein